MNAKITIEALVPVNYTAESLEDHVRNVLPPSFRVFDVNVELTESVHGEEARRTELRKPANNPAQSAGERAAAKKAKASVALGALSLAASLEPAGGGSL